MIIMKFFNLILAFSCFFLSCSNNCELTEYNYLLFQGTPVWELAKATRDNNGKEMRRIISKNPDIVNYQEPKYGNTLIMLTILNQQYKPFKVLLDSNADVNIHNTFDGSSAIIKSVSLKDYDIRFVNDLILSGADVNDIEIGIRREGNSTRNTPLISAVNSGNMEFVRLLVSKGAMINYRNEFDQSALSESIVLKYYKIAYYLLQHGADFESPIFYRPDYSLPSEERDPNDKGKPMFIVDVLRESVCEFDTEQYQYKMKIVDFLKSRGVDYKSAPIPDYIIQEIQKKHPDNWQDYLKRY